MKIVAHPLGIRPSGNALLDDDRRPGMGLFGRLPDEIVMTIVQELDAKSLLALGHTCKGLFAYCWFDELWKQVIYERKSPDLVWKGSWRRTALGLDKDQEAQVSAEKVVYSDLLHRPYELSQIDYQEYIDPEHRGKIPTFSESEMTVEKFDGEWHNKPFVVNLSKPIAEWTMDDLVEKYGELGFRQEYMDWKLKVYVEYARENHDEVPLYLFDCHSKAHQDLVFEPPLSHIFGTERDYFALFGKNRPDHQWLIVGPSRSGSGFHKDPNATSAWNSVVSGHKYWIMFPGDCPPPGIYTDQEQSEVTAPVSLAEWFASGFYTEAKKHPNFRHAVTGPGQVMYVPSGWWHAVVNLDENIAMTGNFVAEPELRKVLAFLKNKPDQISGFKLPAEQVYHEFVGLLKEKTPEIAEKYESADCKKRSWRQVTEAETPFTFNFE
ncbi:hypothetical protein B9G98_03011 [Wickerhamiella sorbophila]|uniref:F-box protein n=1 Tax=Wickerhamiella sorbophila TaxID=45607 RepID=A0A2T0FK76_9ASCO|nr:hypothetical protein B9G98_03011 [Wickerhamiella sorbophila]PRT55391.1 hypothetical protein B9G98_03011 [Wickerhamiella sorbophila]